MNGRRTDYRQTALAFTRLLSERNYKEAYGMTSREYRAQVTMDQMQEAFEDMVPLDWGTMGPIEVGETMEDWPGRTDSDLGWVYVSVGGDVYSEAVMAVVMLEDGEPRIRDAEFGRP